MISPAIPSSPVSDSSSLASFLEGAEAYKDLNLYRALHNCKTVSVCAEVSNNYHS